jgi:hypothetical protein
MMDWRAPRGERASRTMTKIKALSVIQCRDYVLEVYGADGMERLKAAMPVEARRVIYSDELLPTDWVEVSLAVAHGRAIDNVFGIGDGQECFRMIHELTTRHAAGLYKSVLSGGSSRSILERAGRLWTRYYDQGETLTEMVGETTCIKRIVGCPDLPRYHDWFTTPYYEMLLRHSGAKDIVVKHTKCVANGADCCETELRWKPDRSSTFPFDM